MRLLCFTVAISALLLDLAGRSEVRADAPLPAELRADAMVIGATPSGIAAAVAAARCGRSVILVEAEDHVGGIIANGLTRSDINNRQAVGGIFYEFTRRVLRRYQAQDGTAGRDGPNVKLCREGYWCEATVAERVFRDMLDEQERITLLLRHQLRSVESPEGVLRAVTVEDRAHPEQSKVIRAGVFIDATYEGDLAALAKAPYKVGRESRDEYGEPLAGKVYTKLGTTELLSGSTSQADQAVQAYCFRFHMTTKSTLRVPVEKPLGYQRDDYRALLADLKAGKITHFRQVLQVNAMPNDRYEINSENPDAKTGAPSDSLDLAEENWGWPEATPEQRRRLFERYVAHNVGLIWFLQNDEKVPQTVRDEAKAFGWCKDEWTGNHHLPRQLYVREARRIVGEYTLTEKDGDGDGKTQRTRLQPTSVAIAEYGFDSHGCRKYDTDHPGVREGYFLLSHQPIQVPYGVLVPRKVDGLLVPVACSASHVGYQVLRLEPVYMALGEASGIAAHVALRNGTSLRKVSVGEVQQLLVQHGAVITHLDDVPFDHPAFAALQWLGARGFNLGYRGEPEQRPSKRAAAERLLRVFRAEGKTWMVPDVPTDKPVLGSDVAAWLREAGLEPDSRDARQLEERELNTAQIAVLVYGAFRKGPAPK